MIRIDALSDAEMAALTALVFHDIATLNANMQRFGEPMRDPDEHMLALRAVLQRRRVLPDPTFGSA